MKQIVVIALALLSTSFCTAQDFKANFDKHFLEGDTTKQREILSKWEKEDPYSAELFTSYFNYYVLKSRNEVISMTPRAREGQSLSIQDSSGQAIAFLGGQITYDLTILQKGLAKIDEGIKRYPNRLDMRFGKIHVFKLCENWEDFTSEIIRTITYSASNDNNWTWTYNEPVKEGKSFLLQGVQDYQLQLYNSGNDALLKDMQHIANEVLAIYPTHVESLSNLSITYMLTGEYEKAISDLLKAEKIDPKDVIVLANIAHGYELRGNKEKSIEYYDKIIKFGNKEDEDFAKQQIERLKQGK